MKEEGFPTYITDNFPMWKLECQYANVCSEYIDDDCGFDKPCAVRWKLRDLLEDYVAVENLRIQIEDILDGEDFK